MRICRADDGASFQINSAVYEVEQLGVGRFLQEVTGIPEDACIAYISDGRRLTQENVRELAGVQDQAIFVFNKLYLEMERDQVLLELHLEPPDNQVVSTMSASRPSRVSSIFIRSIQSERDTVHTLLSSMAVQLDSLKIASASVDSAVLPMRDAFEAFAASARRELEKQDTLLQALPADLDMISRIEIHNEFLSPAVKRGVEAGDRSRTLGDFVSRNKMLQVGEQCARVHEELKRRFTEAEVSLTTIATSADSVRKTIHDFIQLADGENCGLRTSELMDHITDITAEMEKLGVSDNQFVSDLQSMSSALHTEVERATDLKNSCTALTVDTLRKISTLNNSLIQLPNALSTLQSDLRKSVGFVHVQRLHGMIYAYGATIVEIIRRREFDDFFGARAQSIAEVMAKVSSSERKRRQIYRSEIQGQLPFDPKAGDQQTPSLDISVKGDQSDSNSLPVLDRSDLDAFLNVLFQLERTSTSYRNPDGSHPIVETRSALEKLVSRMDSASSSFDRMAERNLLSASRMAQSRKRSITSDDPVYQDLLVQIRELQTEKANQDVLLYEGQDSLRAEISRLKFDLQAMSYRCDQEERNSAQYLRQAEQEQEKSDRLELDLEIARAQNQSDAQAREALERRLSEARNDGDARSREHVRALDAATSHARESERLRVGLVERVEALAQQLRERDAERDKLARDHDRLIRDHIAEADGDRAVLELQFSELRGAQTDAERALTQAQTEAEVLQADVVGLREELEREKVNLSALEQRLDHEHTLLNDALAIAIAFRNSHSKVASYLQSVTSHPGASRSSTANGDPSVSPPTSGVQDPSTQKEELPKIDASVPTVALQTLRGFDLDGFFETVLKTGPAIRKWQKQTKEYRERAKSRITFRNFAKGDLALFLPTRNSVSKAWAAFNVSSPHYFLQATGQLLEQLRTREWIVARITSITGHVASLTDPDSNPYGLGDGVKYHVLEVEDWSQPSNVSPAKRKSSSRRDQPSLPPEADAVERMVPVPVRTVSPSNRPSHLSKLLAQADSMQTDSIQADSMPKVLEETPSPDTAAKIPESSTVPISGTDAQESPAGPQIEVLAIPIRSSPMDIRGPITAPNSVSPKHFRHSSSSRPASRGSRASSHRSSVLSGGRMRIGSLNAGSKAAATTALSDVNPRSTPSSVTSPALHAPSSSEPFEGTPSPADSATEGMSSVLHHRQRTASVHSPPSGAGLALANIASSWLGRRRQPSSDTHDRRGG